ncbi:MAG: hypothetical protein JWQ66_1449 [Mucilaginibacter sp.]|nr:hypothetical protein [Mucilaginibacter sp.]
MNALQHGNRNDRNMVVSFLIIRRAVGILGIALPVVVALGIWLINSCHPVRESISSYYYTVMGNYFTGTLCAVALFLFTYRGPDYKNQVATNIASVFALGTALFPTNSDHLNNYCNIVTKADSSFSNTAHYLFAAAFFITLALISLLLFPKLDPGKSFTPQKHQRNILYRAFGIIMFVVLALILSMQYKPIGNALTPYKAEFWFEAIALWAFGFSWLIKGKTLLKDK